MMRARTWLYVAVALTLPFSSLAQEPNVDRVEDNLATTNQELQSAVANQKQLETDVAQQLLAESEITTKLVAAARDVVAGEQALITTNDKMMELEAEEKMIRRNLLSKQESLSKLLAALQVLEQNPPPAFVVAPGDIVAALRGAMMFGAVVPEMRDDALRLINQLERQKSIRQELLVNQNEAKRQLAALQTQHMELNALLVNRQNQLKQTQNELAEQQKRASELAKKSKNLEELLNKLQTEETNRIAKLTAKAKAEEDERARQLALAPPTQPMSQRKGTLDYPVQGQILGTFGSDNGVGGTLNGITIAVREGFQVRSPVDGKVKFAGRFRSYGELIIINAGEGFLVLIAGLENISVKLGQTLRAGEPIGMMGQSAHSGLTIGQKSVTKSPILYVELRKNGKPIDQQGWWIGSRKEANQ